MSEPELSDADFQALAAFRASLRRFLRFSESAARAAGLSPQQHQMLIAIRGHAGDEPPVIGELADALQIRHHSAGELIDRMAERGVVRRETSSSDSRRVHILITPEGEAMLRVLTSTHRAERQQLAAVLKVLNENV
jgi:DNA-binding MarR family transcriptional regulator